MQEEELFPDQASQGTQVCVSDQSRQLWDNDEEQGLFGHPGLHSSLHHQLTSCVAQGKLHILYVSSVSSFKKVVK